MRKKLLFFLCLCLFVGIKAFAYDAEIDGIYYNFYEDVAEVTCRYYDDEWQVGVSDYSGDIVILESVTYNGNTYSVTSISDNAFQHCKGLTSVSLPQSIMSIGKWGFEECGNLTSVILPNNMTGIGGSAFVFLMHKTTQLLIKTI